MAEIQNPKSILKYIYIYFQCLFSQLQLQYVCVCVYSVLTKSRGNFNGFSFIHLLLRFITNTTCNGICCLCPPARTNQEKKWSQNKSKMIFTFITHSVHCKTVCHKNKSEKKLLDDTFWTRCHYINARSWHPTKQKLLTTNTDVCMSFLWSRLKPFWCKSFRANC